MDWTQTGWTKMNWTKGRSTADWAPPYKPLGLREGLEYLYQGVYNFAKKKGVG